MLSDAIISKCETYRYRLHRIWQPETGLVNFIGLNPSRADASLNDPTIHKCMNYARAWRYGGIIMTNLFAYRSPYPDELFKADVDIVGIDTDEYIKQAHSESQISVAVWGDGGAHNGRGKQIEKLLPDLQCLKISAIGQPRHPRYLKGDLTPIPFKN